MSSSAYILATMSFFVTSQNYHTRPLSLWKFRDTVLFSKPRRLQEEYVDAGPIIHLLPRTIFPFLDDRASSGPACSDDAPGNPCVGDSRQSGSLSANLGAFVQASR